MSNPQPPKTTGLMCPNCKQPIATIGRVGPNGVTLNCPGCGHRWPARDSPATSARCMITPAPHTIRAA